MNLKKLKYCLFFIQLGCLKDLNFILQFDRLKFKGRIWKILLM